MWGDGGEEKTMVAHARSPSAWAHPSFMAGRDGGERAALCSPCLSRDIGSHLVLVQINARLRFIQTF